MTEQLWRQRTGMTSRSDDDNVIRFRPRRKAIEVKPIDLLPAGVAFLAEVEALGPGSDWLPSGFVVIYLTRGPDGAVGRTEAREFGPNQLEDADRFASAANLRGGPVLDEAT